jgi:hypothetical protein
VKAVIVGERMPLAYRTELMAILEKNYARVPVKTARRAQSAFTLVID